MLFLCLFLSCTLEDERDECCDSNTMRYRFLYRNTDCFLERVKRMEYHLFGSDGSYMGEMKARDGDISRVSLEGLAPGCYTLVGIGNLTDYGRLSSLAERGLESFQLLVSHYFEGSNTVFSNGEPLYWGLSEFTVERGGSNSFVTDMSHVHCCLHLRVEWELLPAYPDGYRFGLRGVGTGMDMHASNASVIGGLPFPRVHGYAGSMLTEVPLRQFALETRLYTLRLCNASIPVFRLYHGEEAVTKDIDLARVFTEWGWNPDNVPVQEYQLRMLIRPDGHVEVKQGFEAGVSDWIDGGIIGT